MCPAHFHVHVDSRQGGERGDLAGFVIPHLVKESKDLFADLDDPGSDGDNVSGPELPLVGSVLLHGRHKAVLLAQIRSGKPKPRKHLP